MVSSLRKTSRVIAGFEVFVEGIEGGAGGSAADHAGGEGGEALLAGRLGEGAHAHGEGPIDEGEAVIGHDDDGDAMDGFFGALGEGALETTLGRGAEVG